MLLIHEVVAAHFDVKQSHKLCESLSRRGSQIRREAVLALRHDHGVTSAAELLHKYD